MRIAPPCFLLVVDAETKPAPMFAYWGPPTMRSSVSGAPDRLKVITGERKAAVGCRVDGAQSPAEVYEDFLVRWQFRPWTAVLLAEAAILPGERILDLATGTGIVAREAAPFVGAGGRVVALDINPAMLAVGRSRPDPAGAAIEWLEGDAAALPLPDAAFDAVLCQQGLQYFAGRTAAAAEVRRVLAPGGRALLVVWRALAHNPVQEALNAAGQYRVGVAPLATAFGLGNACEVRRLFEAAGFTNVTVTDR